MEQELYPDLSNYYNTMGYVNTVATSKGGEGKLYPDLYEVQKEFVDPYTVIDTSSFPELPAPSAPAWEPAPPPPLAAVAPGQMSPMTYKSMKRRAVSQRETKTAKLPAALVPVQKPQNIMQRVVNAVTGNPAPVVLVPAAAAAVQKPKQPAALVPVQQPQNIVKRAVNAVTGTPAPVALVPAAPVQKPKQPAALVPVQQPQNVVQKVVNAVTGTPAPVTLVPASSIPPAPPVPVWNGKKWVNPNAPPKKRRRRSRSKTRTIYRYITRRSRSRSRSKSRTRKRRRSRRSRSRRSRKRLRKSRSVSRRSRRSRRGTIKKRRTRK